MSDDPLLDRRALGGLRRIARGLATEPGRAVPFARLVELARTVPVPAGLTVDLEATRELGEPLLVLRIPARGSGTRALASLSPREREVCALVAEGLVNKQIAARLSIRLATVKDHVHRILRKTGLPNRAAVASAWTGAPEGS
jgi:DNA-binding NarL/FixJ family response regulator